jgi:hypothetical protein
MTKEIKYTSALTGAGFMMYEFKQLVALKIQGLTDKEMKQKVIQDNIFQYKKISSMQRAFPYLLKRVHVLDDRLMRMVVSEDIQTAKIINLYAIMKIDRLFYEFMQEVVRTRLEQAGELLEKKEINIFFTERAEQSSFVHHLADSTIARLKAQFATILSEAGVLDLKSRQLHGMYMDEALKNHFMQHGEAAYVKALGDTQ